jgi:hypothetical protein
MPRGKMDFRGMAPVSDGAEEAPRATLVGEGPRAIGSPSAGLSLVGLRPRRARLCFTRRAESNETVGNWQEQRAEAAADGLLLQVN